MSSAATNGRLVVVTHPSGNRIDYVWAENNRYGQITSITMNPANSNGVGTNTASTVPLLSGIEYTGLGQAKSWKWGKHSAASTSTAQPTLDHSFTYDATGNRTSQSLNGTTFTHTVSATSNKLTQVAGPTAYTPVYDAMGNLTSNGTATFTYSDRGRLKTALVGTNSIAYLYNALEQRVRKSGPSTIIPSGQALYAYDEQGQLLGDYTSTNIANYETVYLGSMPVAVLTQTRTGTSPNFTFATTVNYAYADQIDTVRVITQASDNKTRWRWDAADPFGTSAPNENPSAIATFKYHPRFPGQVYDQETNWHYNWHRNYEPQTGRYVQSDPIGLAGGLNTYAYVEGIPVNFYDPDGK